MSHHQKVLKTIVNAILSLPKDRVQRVAIDGVDGAGKTVFANEIAPMVESLGRPAIRASVDGFHNSREIRYRLGKTSPEGFFQDSYNYTQLKNALLNPLSPGEDGTYLTAIFDVDTNQPISVTPQKAKPLSILIFDGIFLHRPELKDYWDYSIFLDVNFDISIPRGAQRGTGSSEINSSSNVRYIEGQKIYLSQCQPINNATTVINYNDLSHPKIIK